jgi:hypothetical protein
MTTRTAAQVRQDFAARIVGIGGAWNLAPVPWALFGPSLVPDAIPSSKGHLAFAVGLTATEAMKDRQRASEGVETRTRVSVKFLARLTPKDQLTSDDAALDAELALIQRIVVPDTVDDSPSWPLYFHAVWRNSARTAVPTGEWFVCESQFDVYHRTPLQ